MVFKYPRKLPVFFTVHYLASKLLQHKDHHLCKPAHLCKLYNTSRGLARGSLLEMLSE